jgi:RNA polymerase sigma factor (sigma-70 family)
MTDDRELVSRITQGDPQAFRQLIHQYQRLVGHMVARLIKSDEDREEICQDVFLKVYDKIGGFNFESKLSTWIATVAYRHAINHLRKQKMMFADLPNEEGFQREFVSNEKVDDDFGDQQLEEMVLKMIDYLPAQYKTVLTLYHISHMNYQEIGEITNMPEGTVKNYLFRARNILKEKVKNYLGKEIEP